MPAENEKGGRQTEPMQTEEELSPQEYEHLLAQYENSFKNLQEGQIIRGRVLAITPSEVIVDIGYKSEGIISLAEFTDFSGNVTVHEGDAVDVLLERTEDQNGYVVLSKDKAEKMKVWDEVERSYRSGSTVRGRVIDRIKGGLAVDIGVKAFLPGSLVDVKPVKNLESLRGKELDFKVISVDKKRGNIVLSRKAVVEIEQEARKRETLQLLEEGRVLRGVVKNLTDYGAFVDLGGLDGLLHVTDMSWKRVNHPSDVLGVGATVRVQVIRFNRETQRISLGMKQLEADPWEGVELKYPVGAKFTGRVTNITDYGAFVELEPGIEGLVHVSEMSWTKKNVHPGKIVSTSQEVEVMVLDVDPVKRRISLGLKQCLDNPWTSFVDKYPVGTELEGDVKNITEFGLFVGLPGEIDGMVHLSDLSWDKPGEEAVQAFKKGDSVKVKVLDVDVEKERISLGIKQLQKDTFAEAANTLKKGSVVTCTVTAVVDGGIEVAVQDGLSGFIKKADLSRERSEQRPDRFAVGEKVDAKIIQVDPKSRRLTLSIKAREVEEDKQAMAEFGSSDSGASLGDILGAALNKAKKGKKDEDEA